jgi:hypothetical protein
LERERPTPVAVDDADLYASELFRFIDHAADLNPFNGLGSTVRSSELHANDFVCMAYHATQLKSSDATRYLVQGTDLDSIEFVGSIVTGVDL